MPADTKSLFLAEFIGTALLILLGNGVVANVVLNKTKGFGAGWIVITFGWAMAVFVAVACVGQVSGAQINPAVTLASAMAGKTQWSQVPVYLAGQFLGGFVGACLVYLFYRDHFHASTDPDVKLACFSTNPAIRNIPVALFCETLATFVLILAIFLMSSEKLEMSFGQFFHPTVKFGLGALGAIPVALLILAIGLSLGGTTGYAINPVRDFAPRLAHRLLPIPGKRDSDWPYAWVPIVGPFLGAVLAVLVARLFQAVHTG
jgi:glycerol uptake facilitator protein